MNKWKIAFWCSLVLLVFTILFSKYILINQAYDITYYKEDSKLVEEDFEEIIDVINNTDLSKHQIAKLIARKSFVDAKFLNSNDTISTYDKIMDSDYILLNKVKLYFDFNDEDNKLTEIQKRD